MATANNIIRRYNGPEVTITVEETFSSSVYPDNHFYYVLRSVFTNGDTEALIGYYDRTDAVHDFNVLRNQSLGMIPEAPTGQGIPNWE